MANLWNDFIPIVGFPVMIHYGLSCYALCLNLEINELAGDYVAFSLRVDMVPTTEERGGQNYQVRLILISATLSDKTLLNSQNRLRVRKQRNRGPLQN